jgi:hypothetical protein
MNLIADIRAENGTHAKQGHSRACPICAAQDRAWKAFASLNGWKMVERGAPSKYAVDCIGKGFAAASSSWRRQSDYDVGGIFDHVEWFHADRRFVALVTQPYPAGRPVDDYREKLESRGLAMHLPADPFASIHYPGACHFIVITKAGTAVKFLPEQMATHPPVYAPPNRRVETSGADKRPTPRTKMSRVSP